MTAHPLDDLDLLIAVANTAHDLSTPDELRDGTSAAAWWHDLSGERTPNLGSQADVELLRAARAVIRRLGLRNNGVSTDVELGPLATLPLNLILDARPGLAPPAGSSTPAREIAGRAVAALIRWSGNPQAARLKACPGPDCAWVFHDTTRNRSRRWCDMAACGNRAKAAAFRARAH
ncbi:CGNR zinc finger domain-containing protein [Aeromicrobium terrae]|uniref:CGNR zinc finger domain-containing protein n=1 Tax=Aeromicrobium terrae TaxID=2498846 RepID=A0A5C8NLT2_9ACTN|nr:CGNR zinc finger domain-containing protein [Aeromicrobium terrae]TXL61433.1 CGNR zinc finger domain-containing protein [Aeromicrobium terrae]